MTPFPKVGLKLGINIGKELFNVLSCVIFYFSIFVNEFHETESQFSEITPFSKVIRF